MARYETTDLSFDVPTDWVDRTVVAFSSPLKPGAIVPNSVLTRDKLKPGETLEAYGDRTVVEMVKNLAGFKLIDKSTRDVGGVEGVQIKFAWKGAKGKNVVQHMLIVPTGKQSIAGLNLTCAEDDAKRFEPIADRIFQSFKTSSPQA